MSHYKGPRIQQTIRWEQDIHETLQAMSMETGNSINEIANAALRAYFTANYKPSLPDPVPAEVSSADCAPSN